VHLSEWYANNGDVEHNAEKNVGEPDPDTSDEEPEHIHKHVQSEHKNGTYGILVSACDSVWTSQGLNLGPPDYESVKVRYFKISQNIFLFFIWLFIRYLLTLHPKRATL